MAFRHIELERSERIQSESRATLISLCSDLYDRRRSASCALDLCSGVEANIVLTFIVLASIVLNTIVLAFIVLASIILASIALMPLCGVATRTAIKINRHRANMERILSCCSIAYYRETL